MYSFQSTQSFHFKLPNSIFYLYQQEKINGSIIYLIIFTYFIGVFVGQFTYLLLLFLLCFNVQAKILVLEYIDTDLNQDHGKSVESIACRMGLENCYTHYIHTFNKETLHLLFDDKSENFTTVNMSFGWEKPTFDDSLSIKLSSAEYFEAKEKYDQSLKNYNDGIPLLSDMMTANPETLFVAASGNGVSISFIHTLGVAISEKTRLYPSALTAQNIIKVSAINLPEVDPRNIPNYEIAPYANFGLEYVEVAAPVEPDYTGEVINGTSFSAPFISRVADEIKNINPNLTPYEMREILMKSCHIKNIDQAIAASLDLAEKGEESDVYQAQFNKKRKVRDELLNKIGNIILVKCGGVVVQEVALSCAQKTLNNPQTSINDSCLEAQKEIRDLKTNDLNKIQNLWDIRKI